MVENITLMCRRCGGNFPSYKLSFDAQQQVYVCEDCNSVAKAAIPTEARLGIRRSGLVINKAQSIAYKCPHCSFKTYFKKERVPRACPYCDKPVNLENNAQIGANQLLSEVEEATFFDKGSGRN